MASGDKTTKIAIAVEEGRCLYAHSRRATCARCIEACPGGALSRAAGARGPSIDASRCVSCGQCLSSCPLGAFSSPDFSERRLLNRIDQGAPVRLRCFHPYGELDSLATEFSPYHLSTCLAGLTPGALYLIALDRPCELTTSHCTECVLFGKVKGTMQKNFEAAHALLADCGRAANLRESTTLFLPRHADDEMRQPERIENDTSLSARAKFHAVFRRVRKPAVKRRTVPPLRAQRKRVPSWRARLGRRWNEVAHVESGGLYPWPDLSVDAQMCAGCGICMQLCPTGSIEQDFGDGAFSYWFTPGSCVECDLCVQWCPTGAIAKSSTTFEQPFAARLCFVVSAEPCPKCASPLFAERGEETCRMCSTSIRGTASEEHGAECARDAQSTRESSGSRLRNRGASDGPQ